MENMFELAIRGKVRFEYRGLISVEDLWDLTTSQLDSIFKGLNAKLKTEKEESLLGPKEKTSTELELKVAIVRHIVEVKLLEIADRKQLTEKRQKKAKLLEILSEKKDSDLRTKSVEELTKMLEEL